MPSHRTLCDSSLLWAQVYWHRGLWAGQEEAVRAAAVWMQQPLTLHLNPQAEGCILSLIY